MSMTEWKETKFGALLAEPVRNGVYKPKPFHGRGVSVVNMGELFAYPRLRTVAMSKIELSEKEKEKSLLKNGDLIFARRSLTAEGAGKCSLVYDLREETTFESSIIRARPDTKKVSPDFIYYYFNSRYGKYLLGTILRQVAVACITGTDLMELTVSVPPIEEHRAIAEVLSSLDDKIDLLHRQNKTLESLSETLFRHWFIEEANSEWETGTLGDLLETLESGSRPKGGIDPDLKEGIPSIGAESVDGLGVYDHSKTKFVTREFFDSMRRGVIREYDVLIYKDGAYVGRKGMFAGGFPFKEFAVNEHVFILRSNGNTNQTYLYFALDQEELSQLNANSAQPGLNQEAMRSFQMVIPPQHKMTDFENVVRPWLVKIFSNCKQIRSLSQMRDSLLPKLMSREVALIGELPAM